MQIFYALTEITFGTIGTAIALLLLYKPNSLPFGYQRLTPDGTKYPIYVGLGSCTFAIVRGLDNWFKWYPQAFVPLEKIRREARKHLGLN